MSIQSYNVAIGVRVKLNDKFEEKCLGDKYLIEQEDTYFISSQKISSDTKGEYVNISGGSHITSGYAYLDQLDLEFPHDLSDKITKDKKSADNLRHNQPDEHSVVFIVMMDGRMEKAYYEEGYFQLGKTGMNWMTVRDIYGWLYQKDLTSIISESTFKLE